METVYTFEYTFITSMLRNSHNFYSSNNSIWNAKLFQIINYSLEFTFSHSRFQFFISFRNERAQESNILHGNAQF